MDDSIALIILHLSTGYFVIAARMQRNQDFFGLNLTEAGESGGIGRRTGFRFQRRKVWGFESPLSHHLYFLRYFFIFISQDVTYASKS
jgi:hypothetical protein